MKKNFQVVRISRLLSAWALVAGFVFAYLLLTYLRTESINSRAFSPWLALYAIPLVFAILFLTVSILYQKKDPLTVKILSWLGKHRLPVFTVLLAVSILFFYLTSITLDLSNPLVNLGMNGLGMLMYGLTLAYLILSLINSHDKDKFLSIVLIFITLVWLFMAVTRIGLEKDLAFWNVAGVPMLWVPFAAIILLILVFHQLTRWIQKKTKWKLDTKLMAILQILLILAIWFAAVTIWTKIPYNNSHFTTDPIPPDGHVWPSSDARLMDLGGQYLIAGARLETPYFTEKPYYALFLGLIHFLVGQSYEAVTTVQILFLALFPVFLYLLGKQLNGVLFGLALALFGIVKETTTIFATGTISVTHSRLLMTELPTALLLVIFSVLVFKWVKSDKSELSLPLLAGITIGIATYIRTNNLLVLLVFLILLFLFGIKDLGKRIPELGIFMLGVLIILIPWMVYTQAAHGREPLNWKVQAALDTRFVLPENASNEAQLNFDPNLQNGISDEHLSVGTESGFYTTKASIMLGHFLNNQVKALFVLPVEVYPANLSAILEQEVWHEPVTWNGKLEVRQVLSFVVNLIFISLGLSFAWKTYHWAGLVPLFVELSYFFSNALVRTSGSRYLVPVDWVIALYFLLGIWVILQQVKLLPHLTENVQTIEKSKPIKGFWLSLVLGLVIGLSLPILNLSFPTLYVNESKEKVYQRLPIQKLEKETGLTSHEIESFYELDKSVFNFGREIYPIYYGNQTESLDDGIHFTLITPQLKEVLIPYSGELEGPLPSGKDLIVVGCQDEKSMLIKAYFVYFPQSDQLIWSNLTTLETLCP